MLRKTLQMSAILLFAPTAYLSSHTQINEPIGYDAQQELDEFKIMLDDVANQFEIDFPFTIFNSSYFDEDFADSDIDIDFEHLNKFIEDRIQREAVRIGQDCKLSEFERDLLINELHRYFFLARDAINDGRKAVEQLADIDAKRLSKAAFAAALTSMRFSKDCITIASTTLLATLAEIASQKYDNFYDIIHYARLAKQYGEQFDKIYIRILAD